MPPKLNLRSTAVKRIMQEAAELSEPDEDFIAQPLESDIFEWHCTLRGVPGTEYEGGLYHLRVLLPATYPMSAPDIVLMTPSGRFEPGKKPAWGVRTAMAGLRSFWTQGGEALAAIGALDYPKEERRRLAKLSRDWVCPTCGVPNHELLPDAQVTASAEASGSGTSGAAQFAEAGAEVTERSELAAEGNARPDSSESDQGAVTTPPPGPSSAAAPTAVPLPPVHGPTAAAVSTEVPPPVITEPAPVPTPTTTAPVAAPAAAPVQPTPVRTGVSSSPPPPQPGSRPVPPARAAPPASSSPPPPAPAARPQPPAPPAVTGTPSPAESGQVATEPARRGQHAPSGSPLWLDGTIAACVAVLIYLLAKQ
ncbi:ubiquitin conjugating enzyme [Trichosporon asahii var. asahii CBS 8904]|uniref:Ubiquitin conjugating enzyme n=1 Tax=Trichosporon asahii var. asahii (strain CBS 8904) TaxID=1220162 RepID=K1VG38_TRIAC|nr:ubiquitin conjugating enzyme [Trichosporon asahii var. asahii CBS 8904]